MKHFLIVAFFMLAIETGVAQATFGFENYNLGASLDAPVFDSAGNRLFGDNYVAVLYGGPTPDDLTLALGGTATTEPVPFIRIRNGQMGYFAMAGAATIPSVPSGGYAWLQVRAWDLRLGQTYDDVASLGLGGHGQSTLFYARGGDPLGAPPSQPLLGLESFSFVPEPSTWTLLVLGSGILVWQCRRRSRSNDS